MHESYEKVMADPNNLMRPWTFDPVRSKTLEWGEDALAHLPPCPVCGGKVEFRNGRELLVCTSCGLESATGPTAAARGESVA